MADPFGDSLSTWLLNLGYFLPVHKSFLLPPLLLLLLLLLLLFLLLFFFFSVKDPGAYGI